jgi:hypothetical protein
MHCVGFHGISARRAARLGGGLCSSTSSGCWQSLGDRIQSLIADYDYLPKEADLRTVQSVLRRSAHILACNPRELLGQLLGRLPGNLSQNIDGLRSQASEHRSFPWLRPLVRSLTPVDTSLFARSKVRLLRSMPWRSARTGRRAVLADTGHSLTF